jgi:hypothetical protein
MARKYEIETYEEIRRMWGSIFFTSGNSGRWKRWTQPESYSRTGNWILARKMATEGLRERQHYRGSYTGWTMR